MRDILNAEDESSIVEGRSGWARIFFLREGASRRASYDQHVEHRPLRELPPVKNS